MTIRNFLCCPSTITYNNKLSHQRFIEMKFLPVELIIEIEPSELPQANIRPYSYGAQATVLTKINPRLKI